MAKRLIEQNVRDLASKGLTYSEISEKEGVSYSGVVNFCKVHSIEVQRKAKLNLDKVKVDITNGLSQVAIAQTYDVSSASVSKFIKINDLTDFYKNAKNSRPKRVRKSKALPEDTKPDVASESEDTEDEAEKSEVTEQPTWGTAI